MAVISGEAEIFQVSAYVVRKKCGSYHAIKIEENIACLSIGALFLAAAI